MWRVILFSFLAPVYTIFSCVPQPEDDPAWTPLFNGQDLDDWTVKIHGHEVGDNYGQTFRVQDSMIQIRYDQYERFNERFAHLYYNTPFSNYHLIVEYRFVGDTIPGAPGFAILNSGIMLHSQDPHSMPRNQNWPISVEMQLLTGLGDGEPRPTGNVCTPGTEIFYQGEMYDGHCLNSTSDTYDKNAWVRAEAIVYGDSLITHIIEGDTVLQYTKPQIGGGVIDRYDPAMKVDGKLLSGGFIALQSEGQPIDFRRVELRELTR